MFNCLCNIACKLWLWLWVYKIVHRTQPQTGPIHVRCGWIYWVVVCLDAAHIVCIVLQYTVKPILCKSKHAIFTIWHRRTSHIAHSFSRRTTCHFCLCHLSLALLRSQCVIECLLHIEVCMYVYWRTRYELGPHSNGCVAVWVGVCRWKETNKSMWIFYLCSSLVCAYIVMCMVVWLSI